MSTSECVEKYAKKLEREGKLKSITLVNIANGLNLHLARLKPEHWLGVTFTIDSQVINNLEKHFETAFNQNFWEASARGILSQMDAWEEDQNSAPADKDWWEDTALAACGFTRAGELLRHFQAWDGLDAEDIETLLGHTQAIKEATHKLSKLQKDILGKALAHRDDATGLTRWCPDDWFGKSVPEELESKRVAWSRAIQRLETRQLLTRQITDRSVTHIRLTGLGLVVAKRLQKHE